MLAVQYGVGGGGIGLAVWRKGAGGRGERYRLRGMEEGFWVLVLGVPLAACSLTLRSGKPGQCEAACQYSWRSQSQFPGRNDGTRVGA